MSELNMLTIHSRIRRPGDQIRLATILMLTAFLSSCATSLPVNSADPTTSLIFMYVDRSEAPTDLRWFNLQQRTGHTRNDVLYYELGVYDDGIMNHIAAKPGSYTIHTLGGIKKGFLGSESQWIYEFHGEKNGQAPYVVQAPGAYFFGSYKLVVQKNGLLKSPTFDLLPMTSPSEREVLQRLITKMETFDYDRKYPRPIAMARARLREISGNSPRR